VKEEGRIFFLRFLFLWVFVALPFFYTGEAPHLPSTARNGEGFDAFSFLYVSDVVAFASSSFFPFIQL